MSGQLPYDPAAEGAETSFEARVAYGDYLHLHEILGAQKPLTRAHDEMLFIVQHQVFGIVDAPGDSRDRRGAQGCRW